MVSTETIRKSQNSFAGGEIGPKVLGRVDLAKFNVGLRYALNAIVDIEGSVSNRGGLEYGGSTVTDTGTIRYIPFEAPNDISYIIEATDQKFRFYFDNSLVIDAFLAPIEVVTPYLAADLYKMVYTQTNDIMTITCPGYDPRELQRLTANSFQLVTISVNPTITAPTVTVLTSTGSAAGEAEQAYAVSTLDASGNESLPSVKVTTTNDLQTAGDKVVLQWNEISGADAYIVYKRRAGQFGFMGFVRAEDQFSGTAPTRVYQATDNNINPNTSQTPKRAFDPFPTAADRPAVTFIHQQRRAFAASPNKPNSIINSQTGLFNGFKRSIPAAPDDYFEFALGAARTQQIKHVLALDDLIIFTANNEWRLNASNGYSASIPPDLKPQSGIGISDIPPLLVGTDIMFVQASKRTIYRMNYSFDFNKFVSDDISILSKHLFRRRKVVGWCYSQQPQFIVFVFFDDGEGAFFAYNREQQVYAWSRCKTDGFIEACAAIRENGIDKIYMAVRRKIGGVSKRSFERMDSREWASIEESFFVDAGVSNMDIFKSITDISGGVITSPGHSLATDTTFRIYDVIGSDPEDPNFDINTRFKANVLTANTLTLKDYDSGAAVSLDTFEWLSGGKIRALSNVVSGLGHLNGRRVSVLADGFVYTDILVSSGTATIPQEAGIRTAGLPYTTELHTLELEREEQPTRGRKKNPVQFIGRVDETRGIKVGARPDKLIELRERQYEAYNDPTRPGSKIFRSTLPPGWQDELKLIVRQDYPLPVTLLSVIPEYTFGD